MKNVILLGSGGHAKVLLETLRLCDVPVIGVCCPELVEKQLSSWEALPVLGADDALDNVSPADTCLVNGVGMLPGSSVRRELHNKMVARGFEFASAVHPSAVISPSATLAPGSQVMAGAVIQADCVIADNVIINTRASLDHGCEVAAHSHIAPGATVCGDVSVGTSVFIGAGATVIQGLTLGEATVVGAGAVVRKDLAANSRHVAR